ncbi:exosome complex exonuclease RRP44-like [Watersipora subatra]|uniref:exosome complex exonuclease RRP44-like n=1 Tax=Watersipora subatra TaxID=2589382 RepID=UPI00355B36C2
MLKSKVFLKKTKRGGILKIVREHYLRDDIACGYPICSKCSQNADSGMDIDHYDTNVVDNSESVANSKMKTNLNAPSVINTLSEGLSTIFSGQSQEHLLIPDTNVVLHQVDVLEDSKIRNVVILSTVLEEVKHQSLTIYKRLRDLIINPEKHFYVFVNEHHNETYVERVRGESANDRNDRAIREAGHWYASHLLQDGLELNVILLTNDRENKKRALMKTNSRLYVYTVREYISLIDGRDDLLEKLANIDQSDQLVGKEKFEYPAHVSPIELKQGLASGKYLKGGFRASRDNYLEGEAMVDGHEKPLFIQGRLHLNRAVNEDVVAVEMLDRKEWSYPSSLVLEDKAAVEDETSAVDDQKEAHEVRDKELVRPSAKVVGIVKRNWRQYCGMLQESVFTQTNRHLFVAAERRVPKIRIETRQAESLMGKRIIVVIDSWPKNSRYPQGHFVRTLGEIGDKETENEVLLLEHDIPHTEFSQRVLACLPDADWTASNDEIKRRTDLRHISVCSVDPPGCTDIDDALHCSQLPNGNFEVGVHIADVTHFVRPGTALDLEAANRGTTVYLTDRRIDMVPELLSSNLCSLRSNVDRLAFTCIWEITPDAETVSVRFMKSIINSKASLTYADAQGIIEDKARNDEIAQSLRNLNNLAKKLKAKRTEEGALSLSSPEIRFEVDSETHDPIQVQEKQLRETNSMVEEFMLLANVSVAKHIHKEFAQCAVLRRHPLPPYSNFDPMLAVCKAYGIAMDVSSNKSLADSLDKAVIPDNPYFNTMLRILTTRCMMQAKYFASGMMPEDDYYHYGLAMRIYTHFTSPIRRYADVLVHRLLAVAIGADASYPDLLNKHKTHELCQNLNHRHVMAQYASRASVGLHTQLFFKTRDLLEEGYVLTVRKNALQVLIPKYGLEGTLYVDRGDIKSSYDEEACTQTVAGHTFHIFDPVTVRVSLDSTNIQHQKLKIQLVSPKVKGLSVEEKYLPSNKTEKKVPRKKLKTHK